MDTTLQAIYNFASQFQDKKVQSTYAQQCTYDGPVYNVVGSSNDPRINGVSWRALLTQLGVDYPCSIYDPAAAQFSSHPHFCIGGHVTPNANGNVPVGGECLLMPMCHWHNSTARDGIPFYHSENLMVKLSGYMQGELAVTFMARLSTNPKFSIVYQTDDGDWNLALSSTHPTEHRTVAFEGLKSSALPEQYLVFERESDSPDSLIKVTGNNLLPITR